MAFLFFHCIFLLAHLIIPVKTLLSILSASHEMYPYPSQSSLFWYSHPDSTPMFPIKGTFDERWLKKCCVPDLLVFQPSLHSLAKDAISFISPLSNIFQTAFPGDMILRLQLKSLWLTKFGELGNRFKQISHRISQKFWYSTWIVKDY